jgi:hypothetical protein
MPPRPRPRDEYRPNGVARQTKHDWSAFGGERALAGWRGRLRSRWIREAGRRGEQPGEGKNLAFYYH